MAATTKTWSNNNLPQCEDADLNGFKNENNNLILASGQLINTADNQQTNKAVAHYAAGGDFYVDSGGANAYVLTAGGSRTAPPAYFAGMRIRFVADNPNTGASTVEVAGLGAKNLKLPAFPGANLPAAVISGYTEAWYDGADFVIVGNSSEVAGAGVVPQWSFCSQVGSSVAVAGMGAPALATLSATDVAFIDASNDELRTYRFNGASWSQVGAGLNVPSGSAALTALNSTDVALYDLASLNLRTYRFNGASWSQVGNALNLPGFSFCGIAALNASDIALASNGDDSIAAYRFDGTDWSLLGSSSAIPGLGSPAVTALNATDVALIDGSLSELRTYRFNGATWAQVGTSLAIAGAGAVDLAALNDTDVAFIDSNNEQLRTYRFNGVSWSLVSVGLEVTGVNLSALCILNGTDVVLADNNLSEIRAYRFAFAVGVAPRARQLTG